MSENHAAFDYTCKTVEGQTGQIYVEITIRRGPLTTKTHLPLGPGITKIQFRPLHTKAETNCSGETVQVREIEPFAEYIDLQKDRFGKYIGEPGTIITESPPLYLFGPEVKLAIWSNPTDFEGNDWSEGSNPEDPRDTRSNWAGNPAHLARHCGIHNSWRDSRSRERTPERQSWHRFGRATRFQNIAKSVVEREADRIARKVDDQNRTLTNSSYLKAKVLCEQVRGIYFCDICGGGCDKFAQLVSHMHQSHSVAP